MQGKAGAAAVMSGIFTLIAGLSLSDIACIVGILSTAFLTIWKVWYDLKMLKLAKSKGFRIDSKEDD